MKPSEKKKIDDFIDECANKFLFEQEEDEGTFDVVSKFLDNEEKKTKTAIDSDNRIKGAQIEPLERAIKEKQIKINKDKLVQLQKLRDTVQKSMVTQKQAEEKENKETTTTLTVGTEISEQAPIVQQLQVPKKKVKRVMFEKSTGNPFYVDFSERGFLVGGTRLSFETLETALSKNYNIVLDGGKGMTLDQVRMQKILKYKDVA